MKDLQERKMARTSGFLALLMVLALWALSATLLVGAVPEMEELDRPVASFWVALASFVVSMVLTGGFVVVQPNEAKVFTFFGRYVGAIRESGFHFVNPLAKKKTISLRVRNFGSPVLKVNDLLGNPIEIGAVVVWRVSDCAKALYNVDNYESFVTVQAETALRNLAGRFPYDGGADHGAESLRGTQDEVAAELKKQLLERLSVAGVSVEEARLSHLAYAPEIAQAMLRRQQAAAVIAARRLIVDGAVGMVKMALSELEEQGVVTLDNERRAAMVNNLLVALVSESEAQPVINTGTLYT